MKSQFVPNFILPFRRRILYDKMQDIFFQAASEVTREESLNAEDSTQTSAEERQKTVTSRFVFGA